MTLTCPACGAIDLRLINDTCNNCGFAGKPVMMSDKDRTALREKHERAIAARTLPEGYDQAQAERDKDALSGPTRFAHTPQGTRMKGV